MSPTMQVPFIIRRVMRSTKIITDLAPLFCAMVVHLQGLACAIYKFSILWGVEGREREVQPQ